MTIIEISIQRNLNPNAISNLEKPQMVRTFASPSFQWKFKRIIRVIASNVHTHHSNFLLFAHVKSEF